MHMDWWPSSDNYFLLPQYHHYFSSQNVLWRHFIISNTQPKFGNNKLRDRKLLASVRDDCSNFIQIHSDALQQSPISNGPTTAASIVKPILSKIFCSARTKSARCTAVNYRIAFDKTFSRSTRMNIGKKIPWQHFFVSLHLWTFKDTGIQEYCNTFSVRANV